MFKEQQNRKQQKNFAGNLHKYPKVDLYILHNMILSESEFLSRFIDEMTCTKKINNHEIERKTPNYKYYPYNKVDKLI